MFCRCVESEQLLVIKVFFFRNAAISGGSALECRKTNSVEKEALYVDERDAAAADRSALLAQ